MVKLDRWPGPNSTYTKDSSFQHNIHVYDSKDKNVHFEDGISNEAPFKVPMREINLHQSEENLKWRKFNILNDSE